MPLPISSMTPKLFCQESSACFPACLKQMSAASFVRICLKIAAICMNGRPWMSLATEDGRDPSGTYKPVRKPMMVPMTRLTEEKALLVFRKDTISPINAAFINEERQMNRMVSSICTMVKQYPVLMTINNA